MPNSLKIIAESSATRTEWVIMRGGDIIEHAFTSGMNPYFQTRRELSHAIRLELPEVFFKNRYGHVYYYGAGCATTEKKKIMESSLVAQFRSPVNVESDLLGAARGLFVRDCGIAVILGTGSNSCVYNGEEIIRNVPPLGYVLGDEGSSAYFGKIFVADVLKGFAPSHISTEFFREYNVSHNMLLNEVYAAVMPSRSLARYGLFLEKHLEDEYVKKLVYDGIMLFFRRNIVAYDYHNCPVRAVGSSAVAFERILREVAKDFGVSLENVCRGSMSGLVEYHK